MKEIINLIALAGLLHDIGKFRQRTGKKVNDALKSQYCPNYKSNYSHLHAAHTAEAIDEMALDLDLKTKQKLINLAASHHLNTIEGDAKIIQIADRYASQLDRKELEENGNFIKTNLMTPFSYIKLDFKPFETYYPVQKLEGKIKITDEKESNSKKEYEKLYNEFIEEIKKQKLTFKTIEDFLILKSIFEKYTTFIPSSTYFTYPDVSLFDHSLATAAIAVAIKNGNEENFSLIQGDFTAIQSFIFSKMGESNKFITKILRAKSLFVNILTEIVAFNIVKELNLSIFNIVMNAGGKFTILSHKLNDSDLEKLNVIKQKANKLFSNINYLQTKFIIGHIDFNKDKFKLGEFKDVFKDMALKFEEEKLKFDVPFNVFNGYIESLNKGKCDICGINPAEEEIEKTKFCKYCLKFKEIGENTPKANYIKIDLDDWFDGFDLTDKKPDGLYYSLENYPLKRIANYVPKFNGNEDMEKYKKLLEEKFEEIKIGNIKTFYHIAADGVKKENEKYKGRKYLAILKADVDNLGKIFINGFGENSTFSRTLYLSRMLDYFFTTELMDFIEGKNVYTVFAGGDDLFLIGHYEDIIITYDWIIKRFREYTNNPNFHLSAAIKLFNANVPVNLIADLAEEELEVAKGKGKNKVYVFDNVIENNEFELFVNEKTKQYEEILNEVKNYKESDSGITFFYKLYTFIEMKENLDKTSDLENFIRNAKWKALFRYLVSRNFKDEYLQNKINVLGVDIDKYGKKMILPLNLVLYKNRTY
jgi:CRISPR-associated protein Csm1